MSDITKCNGNNCPMKDQCKRFTATDNEYRQSYFLNPPFKLEDNKFDCKMFWGDTQDSILNQLVEITNKKS